METKLKKHTYMEIVKNIEIDNDVYLVGSSLKDSVIATKAELIKIFGGKPFEYENEDGDKTTTEFRLNVTIGEEDNDDWDNDYAVCLYDYKEGHIPSLHERIKWHIGAFDSYAAYKVSEFISRKIKENF